MAGAFQHEQEFRDLVLEHYERLSGQQRAVADFMLEHVREVAFMGVPELAAQSGASEATCVRFAQRIGYDGFAELKQALAEALRDEVSPQLPPAAEALSANASDPLSAVAARELENIEHSVHALDREAFVAVADALFEADHVYAYGAGISAHFADLFAYLLGQIGVRADVIGARQTLPAEAVVRLRKCDLVVGFSFPPYSESTLQLLREAKARRVTTLAISDRVSAPAMRIAEHALPVRSDNLMYTNSFAAVSVVLNALTTQAAVRHKARAGKAAREISALLERGGG